MIHPLRREGPREGADRILAVDDEEANLLLLTTVLEREGYVNVVATSEPAEALPLFDHYRPDLVLLDLHMPRLDGFALMERIREHTPPGEFLPILVLTGDSSTEARLRALAGGASDFLAKPFDVVEIVLRVRRLLEARELHQAVQRQNAALERRADRERQQHHLLAHSGSFQGRRRKGDAQLMPPSGGQ